MTPPEGRANLAKLLVYTAGDIRSVYCGLKPSLDSLTADGLLSGYYGTFHRSENEARLSVGLKFPEPIPASFSELFGGRMSWDETIRTIEGIHLGPLAAALRALKDRGMLVTERCQIDRPDPFRFEELKILATRCRNLLEEQLGALESVPGEDCELLLHFLFNPMGYRAELKTYGSLASGLAVELLKQTAPSAEELPKTADRNSFAAVAAERADRLAAAFNSVYPEFGIGVTLFGLGFTLAPLMDARYPRSLPDGRQNAPGEEGYRPSVEAIVWAINSIASAWEGWLHQSKAISHYGESHPVEMEILREAIIPIVKEAAFGAGIERAVREESQGVDRR